MGHLLWSILLIEKGPRSQNFVKVESRKSICVNLGLGPIHSLFMYLLRPLGELR